MPELIYIVDDEPHICQLAALGLEEAGYETRQFFDGDSFLQALGERIPDAVVLDWMMPPPDGEALCRLLRGRPETQALPILMLTAKNTEDDRVAGLDMGADDYIAKPFSLRELAARLRANLRRARYVRPQGDERVLRAGELTVDLASRRVQRGDRAVELTPKEFDLLVVLMKNRGRVMTRDMLLDQVWGVAYVGDGRTVDVHIRYLRQKIEAQPDQPQRIQTLRGVGYRFDGGEG